MSNQLQITGGAKVRALEGVITGTSGVLGSVPLGAANGVATLDSGGKVPVSQLPSSVVTYLGTWNAATNTPTLTNGVGDAGDMYICNVAGTVNFGAGPVTFAVGDWVLYGSGTWQKSNGQNGTVTSVGATITGGAIGITGSPITTAGTLAFAFAGTSGQYVNGAGNLTTFPTLITSIGLSMPSAFSVANSPLTANGSINVTGAGSSLQYIDGTGSLQTFPTIITEAQNLICDVYNETGATLTKGTVVYINGGHGNLPTVTKALATSDATSAQTFGIVQTNITNNNNGHVVVIGNLTDLDTQAYAEGTQLYLSSTTAGAYTSVKQYAPAHLVYVGIVVRSHPTQGIIQVKIQNGFEMDELHNVYAQSPANGGILQYVTSTGLWTAVAGTTTNIAEGTNLYYLDSRARASLSFTAGSGAYNSTTGVITIPTNTSQLTNGANYITLGSLSAGAGISYNSTTGVITSTITQYTDALARAAISGGTGISYNSTTGVITNTITQYTDALARASISLTTTGTSGAATYNSTTGVLNIPQYIGGVTSVFGRTGAVVATEGDYSLTQLSDVTITSPTTGQVLKYNGTAWINDTDANTGTVTSVGLSAPTGFSVTGSPVTSSGTLALAFASGYSLPTNVKQTNWDDAYTWVAAFPTQTGNNGKYLTTNGSVLSWADNPLGTVTSVAMTVPTGLSVSGSPITSSGTLAVTLTAGYSIPTTASQTNWDTAYTNRITSLTTTGSSGAATLVSNVLNIPDYGSALSGYLPLTGGTLTGPLGGTSASFSSTITATDFRYTNNGYLTYDVAATGTNTMQIRSGYAGAVLSFTGLGAATFSNNILVNDSFGLVNVASTSTGFFPTSSLTLLLKSNGSTALTIASSLAATFSSSVTATSFIKTSGTSSQFLKADGSVDSTAYQGALTLTTTGTSGAATLVGNTLNIPQYSGGGGSGITTLNTLTATTQTFAVGTSGTDFAISSATSTHTFNLPDASETARGVVTTGTQTFAGAKTFGENVNITKNGNARTSLTVTNTTSGASADCIIILQSNPGSGSFGKYSGGVGSYKNFAANDFTIYNSYSGNISFLNDTASGNINFSAGGSSTATLILNTSNNLGLNTSTIGSRLQVNGNAAIGYSASTAAPTNGLAVSGNVGIGTTTIGSALQVNGGAAIGYSASTAAPTNGLAVAGQSTFSDNLTVSKNQNNITSISLSNTTSGASAGCIISVTPDSSSGYFNIGKYSATTTAYKFIGSSNAFLFNATAGDIAILNDAASGAIKFGAGGSSTAQMTIASTGVVGIGTTTIGSTLQVNGSVAIGYSASTAAPTNGLAVSGNVAIGSNTAAKQLHITTASGTAPTIRLTQSTWREWDISIAANPAVPDLLFTDASAATELFRIASTSSGGSTIKVNGSAAIGYSAITVAPTNGLAVSGNTGIGTTTIGSKLQVNGNAAIGYSASTAAPTNGLAVSGQTLIGTSTASGTRVFQVQATDATVNSNKYFWDSSANGILIRNASNTVSTLAPISFFMGSANNSIAGIAGVLESTTIGGLAFFTGGSVLTQTVSERMRITGYGEVQLKQEANTIALSSSTYSLTGANAQSLLDLSGTWNTTGNPTAIKLNITNTASGATSNLMDLQVGGVSKFKVDKAGAAILGSTIKTAAPTGGTADVWKLGTVVSGTCVPANFGDFASWFTGNVIEIEVNGSTYYVPAVIRNYC